MRFEASLEDTRGQNAEELSTYEIRIREDTEAPLASIYGPVPGTSIYAGSTVAFAWRAVDEAQVSQVEVRSEGQVLFATSSNKKEDSGEFSYVVPTDIDELRLQLTVSDLYGHSASTEWVYAVLDDEPPKVDILSPPAGIRLVEGEELPVHALVTDDRGVSQVRFFVEQGPVVISERILSAQAIQQAVASGGRVSADLRVPRKPEVGEDPIRIGVSATDSSGLNTEALAEIDILDDPEPPRVVMEEPNQPQALRVGALMPVSLTAEDNVYVTKVTAILEEPDGGRIVLDWASYEEAGRIEEISVPNPDAFGSQIVAQRYFAEVEGRVRLPAGVVQEGVTYEFYVEVEDSGVSVVQSGRIPIEILSDTEPPIISIISPSDVEVERFVYSGQVQVVDDVSVSSIRIYQLGGSGDLASVSALDERSASLSFDLDAGAFDPDDPSANFLTLVAEATDSSGNQSSSTKVIELVPDEPPTVSLLDALPTDQLTEGGLAFQNLRVEDDLVGAEVPVRYFSLLSSLSDSDGAARDVYGDPLDIAGEPSPSIGIDYPEANGLVARVLVGGEPYLETDAGGLLRVHPQPDLSEGGLSIELPAGYSVSYRVLRFTACDRCGCFEAEEELFVDAAEGVTPELLSSASYALVEPIVRDSGGQEVDFFVRSFYFTNGAMGEVNRYGEGSQRRSVRVLLPHLLLLLRDDLHAADALLGSTQLQTNRSQKRSDFAFGRSLPIGQSLQDARVFGYATDRFSLARGPESLLPLSTRTILRDEVAPSVQIVSPAAGAAVVPGQRLFIRVSTEDNTEAVSLVRVFGNAGELIGESAGAYRQSSYEFVYDVPENWDGGELGLLAVVEDFAGTSAQDDIQLPIYPNLPPELSFDEFRGSGETIQSPARLNQAEFWVRQGDTFSVGFEASDDAALEAFELWRTDAVGVPIGPPLVSLGWSSSCPDENTRHDRQLHDVTFDEFQSTSYLAIARDSLGQETARSFVVHPLENIAPEIRILTPADGQSVAAGTFRILLGVLQTDDRAIDPGSMEVHANGVRLDALGETSAGDLVQSPSYEQGLLSIFDSLEQKYSADVAVRLTDESTSALQVQAFAYEVPSGLIGVDEPITLTVVVRDADGAIARDEIQFVGAADGISPEVAVLEPTPGFGARENTAFDLRYRAYDNVKVSRLELYRAYAGREADGTYRRAEYGPAIRTVQSIDDQDFQPASTVNIDTPIYTQSIFVDRLATVASQVPGLVVDSETQLDVWLKLVAYDASGNQRIREISFPVRIDTRPEVDIVAPLPGHQVVEGSMMSVNVAAYDDVRIDSLRLTVTRGLGEEIYNVQLREGPFQFAVPIPVLSATPEDNTLFLNVEAIDSYGAATGDLDQHRALETTDVEIVTDEPPVVAIGIPRDGDRIIEGELMLVQVNATDDVGVDTVGLTVSGLSSGERTFVDSVFPYEFLVEVPYGEAGRILALSASATELRTADARTVTTGQPINVAVDRDDQPPTIVILEPDAVGATAVENREIRFAAEINDNVRVSLVEAVLLVDKNGDGGFSPDEEVALRPLTKPPYAGSLRVSTIADYLGNENPPTQVAARLEIRARDGADNRSIEHRAVTLVANEPPQISDIQLLDSRGFNLGFGLAEIAEGREIVVNVLASDRETGVDSVRLFQAMGADVSAEDFASVGEDVAAPFQFHVRVPVGAVGETLRWRAEATDLDGYDSSGSPERSVTITADQPPTVAFVVPSNNESAIIEGQDIELVVDARDDLGYEGIDRVVFYVNGSPYYTAFDSEADLGALAAQPSFYRALIFPPSGVPGFEIYAVAYDILGQEGRSETITIGSVEDTVVPDVDVLAPADGDILTAGEAIELRIGVSDIGVAEERQVSMHLVREYRDEQGIWVPSAEVTVPQLVPEVEGSDPDNHFYLYTADLANNPVLSRGPEGEQRVRIVTTVVTPNHVVKQETTHEVGLQIASRAYWAAGDPTSSTGPRATAQAMFYTAADQFRSPDETGSLVAAWSNVNPLQIEEGLGNPTLEATQGLTGLFLGEPQLEAYADGEGRSFLWAEEAVGDVFAGVISEIDAESGLVVASKMGTTIGFDGGDPPPGYAYVNVADQSPSADSYLDNIQGELSGLQSAKRSGGFRLCKLDSRPRRHAVRHGSRLGPKGQPRVRRQRRWRCAGRRSDQSFGAVPRRADQAKRLRARRRHLRGLCAHRRVV